MAAFIWTTWRTWFAPGVIGSSQGRPSFTAPTPKRPCGKCRRSRRKPPPCKFKIAGKIMVRNVIRYTAVLGIVAVLILSAGCRKKKYENPITKDTQQPDKVLFDTAIDDIEHGRYERARLTLQTLMNTYDTSEYLAKAKLAVADSWYREGGARGMAQAEAEYKDFILFYKNMEEAAEAQMKICTMQYDQMDKADRDPTHALRAQEECKNLLLNFPNSQHSVIAKQYLRDVQEVLATEEFKVQMFYAKKGSFPASANRGQGLVSQYPLFSRASDSLWMLGDSYQHLGDRFEDQQAAAYSEIVREHPLSPHAEEARLRLQAMKRPVPEVDPVAYAREMYELNNPEKRGFFGKLWGPFGSRPDTTVALKSGEPTMEPFHPTIPASVPATAAGSQGTSAQPSVTVQPVTGGDANVTGEIVKDTSLIDKAPDARTIKPADSTPATPGTTPAPGANVTTTPTTPVPTPATAAPAGAVPVGAKTSAPDATTTGTKTKSLSQQEADIRREQERIKKEKDKIQSEQRKRFEELQKMNARQMAAQAKRKQQEDAEKKKADEAAAKKARRQKISTPDTDKQPDTKQPDKPGPGGGGETPSANR